jgi:hypothetical protein
VFASGGPFLLTVPPPEGGEGEIWDQRTAKPAGKLSAKAYLQSTTRLSPDGQLVAALRLEHADGASTVEVWRPGHGEPAARLSVPGYVLWLDFGATADELFFLTRMDTEDPKNPRDFVQVWSVARRRAGRLWELPDAARLPRGPNPGSVPAALSPGRKYLALLADKRVVLLAVGDGQLLGTLPVIDPGDTVRGQGLWFSDDGAELTGIFTSYRGIRPTACRLQGWKLAGGATFANVVLGKDVEGPPVPGPDPGTVFLTGMVPADRKLVRQGIVVDLKSGAKVYELPLFVALRRLEEDRLLGYEMAAENNKPSLVQTLTFDREKFKAGVGAP